MDFGKQEFSIQEKADRTEYSFNFSRGHLLLMKVKKDGYLPYLAHEAFINDFPIIPDEIEIIEQAKKLEVEYGKLIGFKLVCKVKANLRSSYEVNYYLEKNGFYYFGIGSKLSSSNIQFIEEKLKTL